VRTGGPSHGTTPIGMAVRAAGGSIFHGKQRILPLAAGAGRRMNAGPESALAQGPAAGSRVNRNRSCRQKTPIRKAY
jgi:hypothetical protein